MWSSGSMVSVRTTIKASRATPVTHDTPSTSVRTRRSTSYATTLPGPWFEVHETGVLLHGTKADLEVGDLLVPGHMSNFGVGRTANHVYVTETLDARTPDMAQESG